LERVAAVLFAPAEPGLEAAAGAIVSLEGWAAVALALAAVELAQLVAVVAVVAVAEWARTAELVQVSLSTAEVEREAPPRQVHVDRWAEVRLVEVVSVRMESCNVEDC
jgi:hypothetical protein